MISAGRRVTHKKFSYEPRFYDPKKEEKLKQRMRIKSRVRRRSPTASIISVLILLVLAAFVYFSV